MNRNDILHAQVKDLQAQQHLISDTIAQITYELEQWASKRDRLNQQCKILHNDVRNFKTLRNQFNDQIKRLKVLRETTKEQLFVAQREYHFQEEDLATLQQKVTSNSIDIQQKIKRLEWIIQTSPYSADRERQLINQLTILEHEAQSHRTIAHHIENQNKQMDTISLLMTQINTITSNIQKLARDSQNNHKCMLIKVEQLKQNQEAADYAHQKFIEQRTLLYTHQAQYDTMEQDIQLLILKINQNNVEDRTTSLHHQLTTKGSEVKKKIKAQKRISFNEFKVLKEKGYI